MPHELDFRLQTKDRRQAYTVSGGSLKLLGKPEMNLEICFAKMKEVRAVLLKNAFL